MSRYAVTLSFKNAGKIHPLQQNEVLLLQQFQKALQLDRLSVENAPHLCGDDRNKMGFIISDTDPANDTDQRSPDWIKQLISTQIGIAALGIGASTESLSLRVVEL